MCAPYGNSGGHKNLNSLCNIKNILLSIVIVVTGSCYSFGDEINQPAQIPVFVNSLTPAIDQNPINVNN
jgi:hypothetical protein